MNVLQVANLQPLAGEVLDEGTRLRVLEHAPRLCFQHVRLLQVCLAGQLEQFLVGHAAPQEIRQPAGQFPVVDRLDGLGIVGPSVDLDAEEEVRRHEHGLQGQADAGLEAVAVLLGHLDEAQQALHLVIGGRPAIGPAGEALEDLAGADSFVAGVVDDEDALAGLRRSRSGFSTIFSAAARYFSMSIGGSDSTSPMLSKP